MKPMLAHSKTPDLTKIGYPQIAQRKLDGVRCVVVDGVALSRTLKPIPNTEIQAALGRPEFNGFDGELIVGDPVAPDCYRRTNSFVSARDKTGQPWAYHVYDLHNSDAPYSLRASRLKLKVDHLDFHSQVDRIQLVKGTTMFGSADVEAYEAMVLAEGHEGAILRDPAGLYKFGRSGKFGPLLKVKRFIDFEAEVIGVYEEMHNGNEAKTNALGRTERSSHAENKTGKGTLGGLALRALNGPHEGQEFRCGTGFDAAMRADLWAEASAKSAGGYGRAGLNGRTAKIKAFPVGVKDAPRHPVFLDWRDMGLDG